jgi:hypothetical protein
MQKIFICALLPTSGCFLMNLKLTHVKIRETVRDDVVEKLSSPSENDFQGCFKAKRKCRQERMCRFKTQRRNTTFNNIIPFFFL